MAHESCSDHSKRILDLKLRQVLFKEQNKRLRNFITSFNLLSKCEEIGDEDELKKFDYQIKIREEYSPVSHLNTLYSRLHTSIVLSKRTKVYCRIIFLNRMTESFRQHWLNESLKIMKFFSSDNNHNKLKLYEIFCKDKAICYIFMEKFQISSSLMHVIWNKMEISNQMIKQWIRDLSEAVESLNVCGVAHRFIRAENVLLTINHQRIILTAFDMACIYYDIEEEKPFLQNKTLPFKFENYQLDHLPPECFTNNWYDASQVDVWSIGTLACLLIKRNNPFVVDNGNHLQKWRSCWERRTMSEDWRTLLDDIFQDADHRMTVFDLKSDQRLLQTHALNSKNKNNYYRINLKKNINVDENEVKKDNLPVILLSHPGFKPNTQVIYNLKCYETIPNEEYLREEKNYYIDRNKSFDEEFNTIFFNDHYLESQDNQMNKRLVKIFLLNQIPIRHKNILYESGKIMKYFSQNDETLRNYIHKVVEIFRSENQLFIFYERIILNCRSIYHIFMYQDKSISPSSNDIKQWMKQLVEVIDHLSQHAISHRYIRPEYVFIENYKTVKLTHFDMACFVWNPMEKRRTLRHRGLQDEQEHLWDHLPPECFEAKYDSLLVDIWSFGVLLLFCLVQKNPFTVPHNDNSAHQAWIKFRRCIQKNLSDYKAILNSIFLPNTSRTTITDLKKQILNLDSNESPITTRISNRILKGKENHSLSTNLIYNESNILVSSSSISKSSHLGATDQSKIIDKK